MRLLYFDCQMGAAGDMLTAALYELLDEEGRKIFLDRMDAAGIPGVKITAEPAVKCGITGTHMKVTVDGIEEEPDGGHHHNHHNEIIIMKESIRIPLMPQSRRASPTLRSGTVMRTVTSMSTVTGMSMNTATTTGRCTI